MNNCITPAKCYDIGSLGIFKFSLNLVSKIKVFLVLLNALPTTQCWGLRAIHWGLLAQLVIYRTISQELRSFKAHASSV